MPVKFMPGSVSPWCKNRAEVSILVYVKVRVQALNIVHVTITLCSNLYSCRIRAKLRIRGLVFALYLCLKSNLALISFSSWTTEYEYKKSSTIHHSSTKTTLPRLP